MVSTRTIQELWRYGGLEKPPLTHQPRNPHPILGELKHGVQRLLCRWDLEDMEIDPHDASDARRILARGLNVVDGLTFPVPHGLCALCFGLPWCSIMVCGWYDGGNRPAAHTLYKFREKNIRETFEFVEKVEGHLGKRNGTALLCCYFCFCL